MGKLSSVFTYLLVVNILGFLMMGGMVDEGLASGNPYVSDNSLLVTFFSPAETEGGDVFYTLDNSSSLTVAVPSQPPETFIQNIGQFIDRIFILFDFVRIILGVIFFPILLISFMGLPFELSMMLFLPLGMLYLLGLVDLFAGGSS